MLRPLVCGLGLLVGGGVAAFTLWNDAYPPHVRNDVVVAAACAAAAAGGFGTALWRPVPLWAMLLLIAAVPVASLIEFGVTLSYWEEAGVRCEPPDPVLSNCGLVTTSSDAALGGFAAFVGALALGSLLARRFRDRAI